MRRNTSTWIAAALALSVAACSDDAPRSVAPPTTPADQRLESESGSITVRGDVAPDEFGPLELRGTYRVTFRQRGDGVDFAAEVPFTALLEQSRGDREPRRIELFEEAAATGTTSVNARGRWTLVVDFGDLPFEVTLTPRG